MVDVALSNIGAEAGWKSERSVDAHSTDIGHWNATKLNEGEIVVSELPSILITCVLLANEVHA